MKRSRSRSPAANSSAANSVRSSPSRSPSPAAKVARIEDSPSPVNNPTVNGEENAGGAANNDGDKEEEKEIAESVTGNGEVRAIFYRNKLIGITNNFLGRYQN